MAWVALVTWVVAAGLGFFMLVTWVRAGGARPGSGSGSNFRPPVVFGHFLLAASGLVVWVIYLATDTDALAWIAFAVLVVAAGLGDLLVLRWFKDRSGAQAPVAASAGGSPSTSGIPGSTGLAEQHIPIAAVATHGVFAVATLVLVLLVALGIGS